MGLADPAEHGLHLTEMFEAMEHGELTRAVRDRREPGAVAKPTSTRAVRLLGGLDHLVVQDIFLHEDGRDGRRRAARGRDAGARARAP